MHTTMDEYHTTEITINETVNTTRSEVDNYLTEKIAVPILFAIIFIVGISGNGVLIFTVLRNAALRTKPNILIVSLAIGDLILILVSVPFTSTTFTWEEWRYGDGMCKLNEFMQTLSLGVSVFTLAALSADRYVAIVYPLATYSSSSRRKVLATAIVIWCVSFCLAIMDLVAAHVRPCPWSEVPFDVCLLYPPEWGDSYKKFRVIFRFAIYFVLPVIIIAALYGAIATVLLRQSTGAEGRSRLSSTTGMGRQISSRKRVAKVVLSFVVIFIVCWLPRHLFVIFFNMDDFEIDYNLYWHLLKIIGFCLTFVYSCLNPVILYFLNEEFRRYFRHYLCGCCFKSMRMRYRSNSRGGMSLSAGGATMAGGGGAGFIQAPEQTATTPNISLEDLASIRNNRKRMNSGDNNYR